MATVYESQTTVNGNISCYPETAKEAQSFTPGTSHTCNWVRLKLYRAGTPGTITLGIYAVDASHHPTGAVLASGTVNGDSLTTDTAGELVVFDLGAGASLSESECAMQLTANANSSGSDCFVVKVNTANDYAGGFDMEYYDATWHDYTGDWYFEEGYEAPTTTVTINGTALILSARTLTTVLTETISSTVSILSSASVNFLMGSVLTGAIVINSLGSITAGLVETISGVTVKMVSGTISLSSTISVSGAIVINSLGTMTIALTKTVSEAVVKFVTGTLNIVKSWQCKTKNISTWTNKTKNVSTFTNKTKNSSTWVHKSKS